MKLINDGKEYIKAEPSKHGFVCDGCAFHNEADHRCNRWDAEGNGSFIFFKDIDCRDVQTIFVEVVKKGIKRKLEL